MFESLSSSINDVRNKLKNYVKENQNDENFSPSEIAASVILYTDNILCNFVNDLKKYFEKFIDNKSPFDFNIVTLAILGVQMDKDEESIDAITAAKISSGAVVANKISGDVVDICGSQDDENKDHAEEDKHLFPLDITASAILDVDIEQEKDNEKSAAKIEPLKEKAELLEDIIEMIRMDSNSKLEFEDGIDMLFPEDHVYMEDNGELFPDCDGYEDEYAEYEIDPSVDVLAPSKDNNDPLDYL